MARRIAKGGRLLSIVALPLLAGGCTTVEMGFSREVAAAGLAAAGTPGAVVSEADLAPLPAAGRRYLRFMGVVGRPRDTSFRAHLHGELRFVPGGPWRAVEVWQFNSQPDLARIFHLRMRVAGIPILGRDTYLAGRGRMLVRPLDLFTVQDGRGGEFDLGELVTWLNDAVLLAPGMLLDPRIRWSAVEGSEHAFDLALADGATEVRARVFLDARGAPRDFETTDRFGEDPWREGKPLVRARWTTPIEGWREVDGRQLPTSGRAIWHFDGGELEYIRITFEPGAVAWNVAPGR